MRSASVEAVEDGTKEHLTSFRSSKTFIIIVVSVAIFADVFIYGMVIPLIPAILRDRFHLPDDQLQTWMAILLATFGGALLVSSPVVAYFSDKGSSRKVPFLVGLIAVAGATIMFWLARSPTTMIIARSLQGVAEAAMWTIGNALVVDTMRKDQLGVAMGYVSMSMTIGTMAGPALGGILLDRAGYDSVFMVALALIGVDVVLRLLMIEPTTKPHVKSLEDETEPLLRDGPSIDYQSRSLNQRPDLDVEGPRSNTPSRIPPIVRLAISGQLLVLLIASIVDAAIWTTFETTVPVFVIQKFNWESFEIGMCFLVLTLPSIISPIIGSIIDRYGPRIVSVTSFSSLVPIFILFPFVTDDSLQSRILFIALLIGAGCSFSAVLLPLIVEISEPIERKEKESPGIFGAKGANAQAYALHGMAWASGQLLGPIIAGTLAQTAGWGVMNIVMAVQVINRSTNATQLAESKSPAVTSEAKTTLFGEEYAPMNDSLPVSGTSCPHCGSDSISHDATAAQQRIQELEAQLRIYSEKASETAVRLADYENEIHNLRQQAQSWNNNHESTATAAAAAEQPHPPKTPDANAQQQQQGRFANFASYFPYRRTGSRAGSKDSSTPPQTSHSNYTNSSPGGGGGHTSPTANTSFHSHDASSDSNALALQTALNREQGLRKAAESQLSQAHSELEELTAQLFSQANEMVAQERKARAKLEERVALLERRDGEKRKRLDRLEKAIARVERVRGLINS
ncbi:hypothetical protein ZTR_09909 [Talaromyces verruculosus]|nr:hypothetical protein ZTR_09909 [Talaromyces verruculosus]